MPCPRCADYQAEVPIRSPDDLRAAIRRAARGLADGTLVDVSEEANPHWRCTPFAEVAAGAVWDDIVGWIFACTTCADTFRLGAETYHGSGGAWAPWAPDPDGDRDDEDDEAS